MPIKRLLLGEPLEKVVNRDSMQNPGSLAWFVEFAAKRQADARAAARRLPAGVERADGLDGVPGQAQAARQGRLHVRLAVGLSLAPADDRGY